MKKLINVLLMALYCPVVCAQVELDGMFDSRIPANQVWDGRYLAYTYQGNSHIYDIQTKELTLVKGVPVSAISFYKGFYFESQDDKFLLRRMGEDSAVLPNKFSWVSQWFGNTFVAWEEKSGPEGGILGTWYDIEKGVIARHYLQDIYKAVGFDYEMDFWYRILNINNAINFYKRHFREGLAPMLHPKTKLFGYYDSELNRVIENKYLEADPFFEGLAAVQNENGLWGFINPKGEEVIPFKFRKKPGIFSQGLSRVVNENNKVGFINKNGDLIISPLYLEASHFYKGMSLVSKGSGNWMTLDLLGNESKFPCPPCLIQKGYHLFPAYSDYFPYQSLVQYMDQGMAIFQTGFDSFIVNQEGKRPMPGNYGLLKDLVNGQLIVVEGGNLWSKSDQRFFIKDVKRDSILIRLNLTEF